MLMQQIGEKCCFLQIVRKLIPTQQIALKSYRGFLKKGIDAVA
jgi:hypothetical protein